MIVAMSSYRTHKLSAEAIDWLDDWFADNTPRDHGATTIMTVSREHAGVGQQYASLRKIPHHPIWIDPPITACDMSAASYYKLLDLADAAIVFPLASRIMTVGARTKGVFVNPGVRR